MATNVISILVYSAIIFYIFLGIICFIKTPNVKARWLVIVNFIIWPVYISSLDDSPNNLLPIGYALLILMPALLLIFMMI